MFRLRNLVWSLGGCFLVSPLAAQPLPNTRPLTLDRDPAATMVAGIDTYLKRAIDGAAEGRKSLWKPDYSSPEAYTHSTEPNREHLRRILGVVDHRLPVRELEYVSTTAVQALVAEERAYKVFAVRWPVFQGVDADGLLLEPVSKPVACVVALPDADWTPEMLVSLAPGVPPEAQFARRLAENGCRVLVPTLIDRRSTWAGNPEIFMTNQSHREFLYRMTYEMGRHIIGYEVQKVLAAVDWFSIEKTHPPVGVIGYGEGGLLALYSAALDPRIQATAVSGYFGPRETVWREPIYRNIWNFVREFGDARVASLVAPRSLLVECSRGPQIKGPPPPVNGRQVAAPGDLVPLEPTAVRGEVERVEAYRRLGVPERLVVNSCPAALPGSNDCLEEFLKSLSGHSTLEPSGSAPVDRRGSYDPLPRLHRQFDQLVQHTQRLRLSAETRRQKFWARADRSSLPRWETSCKVYRDYFWEEVIGKLPAPTLPANARTRLLFDEPKWKGYEVKLDLYPDVFAYGILLIPKDIAPGEHRPVVVCQHGLEGRSLDAVDPKKDTPYYHSFGAHLADRGFIVFAPQNPYIGEDKFRMLQRKANPLKLSLFSFIVRQHERILDWLTTLPSVDSARIAFYGLSYGGKTAMRVPAILPHYALSICSGDFNEWIWKNAGLDFRASYMFVGEYEMFEFDLGNTFNYAEMAALIAPRPFMVERGHDDGCGTDERIAYEYAKVYRLYVDLKIPERTTIEYFPGPHEINGKGTFAFLEKELKWSKDKKKGMAILTGK